MFRCFTFVFQDCLLNFSCGAVWIPHCYWCGFSLAHTRVVCTCLYFYTCEYFPMYLTLFLLFWKVIWEHAVTNMYKTIFINSKVLTAAALSESVDLCEMNKQIWLGELEGVLLERNQHSGAWVMLMQVFDEQLLTKWFLFDTWRMHCCLCMEGKSCRVTVYLQQARGLQPFISWWWFYYLVFL